MPTRHRRPQICGAVAALAQVLVLGELGNAIVFLSIAGLLARKREAV